jgi:hypothetical protein
LPIVPQAAASLKFAIFSMPTIPGSKLFAVGQVLLQQDPASFALISPIWEHRVAAATAGAEPLKAPTEQPEEMAGGAEKSTPHKYQWRYDVEIDRPAAEAVRALLWKAATGRSGRGGTPSQVASLPSFGTIFVGSFKVTGAAGAARECRKDWGIWIRFGTFVLRSRIFNAMSERNW